jgi:hypothetical protein
MKHLRPERVRHALHNVHNWALSCKFQLTAHVLPLLAILEKGGGVNDAISFEESDDFDFWNRYFLIEEGSPKPYFNPITMKRAEEGFPHSNAATIRKNTFRLKWGAGTTEEGEDGETLWSLSVNYADIVRKKILTKGGTVKKIPLLEFSVLLFRDEDFPDTSDTDTLVERFKTRFPVRDDDFESLFTYQGEDPATTFTDAEVDIPESYQAVLISELLAEHAEAPAPSGPVAPTPLDDPDDPILIEVLQLLEMGTSGIIFKGPPGTGKTWYAQKIAAYLVNDAEKDIFRVQFHPSYGYEDFVEGFKPDDDKKSGFNVVPKVFLEACDRTAKTNGYVVVIIDEINRGDPARIFGELLTYIEKNYRSFTFRLPFSGRQVSVPKNILLFGTMNPYDRSVSQVDAAFVRRFDHIDIDPSSEVLQTLLESGSNFTAIQIDLITQWFETAQNLLAVGLGHSFFKDAKDLDRLKLVWRYRIRPTVETILEFNPTNRDHFFQSFDALIGRLEATEEEE